MGRICNKNRQFERARYDQICVNLILLLFYTQSITFNNMK